MTSIYIDSEFVTFCQMLGGIIPFNDEYVLNMASKTMFIPEHRQISLQNAFESFCQRIWPDEKCVPNMLNIFNQSNTLKRCHTFGFNEFIGYKSIAFLKVFFKYYTCNNIEYATLDNFDYIVSQTTVNIEKIINKCDINDHIYFKKIFNHMIAINYENWDNIYEHLENEKNFYYILEKTNDIDVLEKCLSYTIHNGRMDYYDFMKKMPNFEDILDIVYIEFINIDMFDRLFNEYGNEYLQYIYVIKTMKKCDHDYNMLLRLSMLNIFNEEENGFKRYLPIKYIIKDKLLEKYKKNEKYAKHVDYLQRFM